MGRVCGDGFADMDIAGDGDNEQELMNEADMPVDDVSSPCQVTYSS